MADDPPLPVKNIHFFPKVENTVVFLGNREEISGDLNESSVFKVSFFYYSGSDTMNDPGLPKHRNDQFQMFSRFSSL